jgi:hypothetical protein
MEKSTQGLLRLYCDIVSELRRRGVIRSTNNPAADVAELLVTRALRLERAPKSTRGYDAFDRAGRRFEIKARRLTKESPSRELSVIRGLEKKHFTHLVGVLFTDRFEVMRACLIPVDVVKQVARYSEHVNGWRLLLRDSVWGIADVKDLTKDLQSAFKQL